MVCNQLPRTSAISGKLIVNYALCFSVMKLCANVAAATEHFVLCIKFDGKISN